MVTTNNETIKKSLAEFRPFGWCPPVLSEQGQVAKELASYVSSLHSSSSRICSARDILEEEFSTPEKANAACVYYQNRPNLKKQTLEKDVPRMNYEFSLGDGNILSNPKDIQSYFLRTDDHEGEEADELILRAANQSLLADLVLVLSRAKVVDQRFQASVVASDCRFLVDLNSGADQTNRKFVRAKCDLSICVPGGEGRDRLTLASLQVGVYFSPPNKGCSEAILRYRILGVKRFLDPHRDLVLIQRAVKSLVPGRGPVDSPAQAKFLALQAPASKLASKFRNFWDTMSIIDEQNNAFAACKLDDDAAVDHGKDESECDIYYALQPFAGASAKDFVLEQVFLEQQAILAQCSS
uniref:Uncharacterized protein n=1 Tax=Trieres chinensis TaxID=1514140 RepID=A0A7S1ZHR8_TRICV|mmetsp:Transcript_25582/g.52359  ORF Transcript_25582/g.52359 Transcript_25582/m.52359 type:complete len:353 (+) Transcript_25582:139-1197(+)